MSNAGRIARREELQQAIDEIIVKGRRHETADADGNMVDDTDEWLVDLRRKVANLDALLARDQ